MATFTQTLSITASAAPATNRVPAPLSGSVTTGSWVAKDINPVGVALPSGKPVHFNYLLPAQYSTNYVYPLLLWLHPNMEGNAWYSGQSGPTDLAFADADGLYNTVNFRTKYPCIVVVGYADQTTEQGSGETENWGGWSNNGTTGTGTRFSGDTGPNTFGLVNPGGVIDWCKSNLSVDPTRIYSAGFSLGAIGSQYLALKYNRVNGLSKILTAGISVAGVLEVNGWGAGPTASDATTMQNVPVWWVGGAQDGESVQDHWNKPMWQKLAGNSNYPAPGTSATAAKAGSSQMRYWLDPNIGHQDTNSSGQKYMNNTTIMDWMFSQII